MPLAIPSLRRHLRTLGFHALPWLILATGATARGQIVFNQNTTISATNLAYESQAIVVSGATLNISGAHQFASVLLTNRATLTHPTNSPSLLHLTLASDLVVAADSAIDLDGRGSPTGQGPGAGPNENCCTAGGSHGGAGGGSRARRFGPTYDSVFEPIALGSGGGDATQYGDGGRGGGAVRITAGNVVRIHGRISANGTDGISYAGGGSGGSVWIAARQILGDGTISASGGRGELQAGGGGGGRIALYTASEPFPGTVLACGGSFRDGGRPGGAGTIYRKLEMDSKGTVILDNCGLPGGTTDVVDGFDLDAHLIIRNEAILAHPPQNGPTQIRIRGSMTIEADGLVSVTGRGNLTTDESGSSPAAACCTGGGSHGGRGGFGRDHGAGRTFDSIEEPSLPGNAGGDAKQYGPGGEGGGALKLTVDQELRIDGRLEADGLIGGDYAGGGAGGSLWIVATDLTGNGIVSSRGGNGTPLAGGGGGGGGGGRIAFYTTRNAFAGTYLLHGGGGSQPGGAGTLFFKSPNSVRGNVILDNHGLTNGVTEVYDGFVLTPDLVLRNGAILSPLPTNQLSTLRFLGNVSVETNSAISATGGGFTENLGLGSGTGANCCTAGASHGGAGGLGRDGVSAGPTYGSLMEPTLPGSGAKAAAQYGAGGSGGGALRLIVQGTLTADGRIESNGNKGGSYAGGGSGGSLWISVAKMTGTGTISASGGHGDPIDGGGGGGGGGGRVALYFDQDDFHGKYMVQGGKGSRTGGGGTVYLKANSGSRGTVIMENGGQDDGYTEVSSPFTVNANLVVRNGARLSPRLGESPWILHFPYDVHIESGGMIAASARGLAGGQGPGAGPTAPSYTAGGSYGGKGGHGNGHPAVTTYGSFTAPLESGSGGGSAPNYGDGGRGGGALQIQVDGELRVDGVLASDGGDGNNYDGGGSGGSVLVRARTLLGSGRITANGGNAFPNPTGGGGGGGGRIALYYETADDALLEQVFAGGGDGIEQGGGGTIYLKGSNDISGELIIDRSPLDKDTAPTEMWGDVVVPGNMRIRSNARVSHPEGHPFHLGVRGDLTIANGASINLDGLGYQPKTGPGGAPDASGAGHGGPGGNAQDGDVGGLAYGDALAPIDMGSGSGNQNGGGAVRLSVQGLLRLNGSITANAVEGSAGGGSAGGSILIHAGQIAGSGNLAANGAKASSINRGGGAGGRIALFHHGTPFATNRISAKGGTGFRPGSDGTLHVETLPTTTPPSLEFALPSPSLTSVALVFSSVMNAASVENPDRYLLSGSARVLAAELQTDLRTVLLTTTTLTGGAAYTVTVSDVLNGLGTLLTTASANFTARGTVRGLAREEVFYGIDGSRLGDLYADPRWPTAPDLVAEVTRLSAQRDDIDGNELGARLTGFLIPEVTGWHQFFMTSDDNGIFYLSQDHTPSNLRLAASEPLAGYPGDWTTSTRPEVIASRGDPAANASMPYWLVAGRYYWFDARFKEATASEHLAVTWQAPGSAAPRSNEGTRLAGDLIARPVAEVGPQVTLQPVGGAFLPGQETTLRVAAQGTGALRFQWYFNGLPRTGETRDTLVLTNLGDATFGSYRVRVTDSVGVVDSSPALLTRAISPLPVFLRQPEGVVANLGSDVVLSADLEGEPPLTLQWLKNGQPLLGATESILSLPYLDRADAGAYTLLISNPNGALESRPAIVSLNLTPLRLADAFADRAVFNQTNGFGISSNLLATAETAGGEPLHAGKRGGSSVWLAWRAPASGVARFSTEGSSFDTLLAVYTGTTLSTLAPVASDEDSGGFLTSALEFNAIGDTTYQIAVDGFAGSTGSIVLSWELDTTRATLPAITSQPASALAVLADPVQFVVAYSPPDTRVQWLFNGDPIPGANQSVLRINRATASDAGAYRARLTTTLGATLDSKDAFLEIADSPQSAGALSADKLDDLFALDEGVSPAGLALQTLLPSASAPIAVGLPGSQWTDNTQSSRSSDDPVPCDALVTASRWFRIRFNVPGASTTRLKLTTEGTAMPSLIAVYTNRAAPRLLACDVAAPPAKPSATLFFPASRGVDYLVLVDGVEGSRGPVRLNWSGEEALPPTVELRNNRFYVELRVVPATYEWQSGDALGAWQSLFRTNVATGIFQFQESPPPSAPERFFRLVPVSE